MVSIAIYTFCTHKFYAFYVIDRRAMKFQDRKISLFLSTVLLLSYVVFYRYETSMREVDSYEKQRKDIFV